MGDFQEPYGAIFGEFDKLGALLLTVLFEIYLFPASFQRRETLRMF
jgi:hypothetical protein